MLSLQRSGGHHTVSAPWFARPVPTPRGVMPRSVSPGSEADGSGSTPMAADDRSLYEEELSFKNRYPQVYKKRHVTHEIELPADPRSWMREDVQTWIQYMSDVHGLPSIQSDRFLMNGKALCLMTMEMFCQRVPLGGKMLYKDFQLRLSMAMYQSSR
ncbi:hypothetical protein TCAL_08769 [Tigriopus californicus]|uniref:PNT domain-containing protein n=1 Tax=Tigriopus californicus TaxID=6832 RepID=A0A553PKR7_TIGCA|nr:uncharacterized protein LOC131890069 [Tigriopus californicus]TRY78274.1 hypothetical protein TCAL_08769 [Tigriopus californicus]|eukprot:TCALIF_08769-PA protein Name:"Similar to aop Ets DNA-binding protein pokkuri (Drosophila melanogaster)" AED:0.00 eAED:0.00 QI:93/1/1/1/1/1/2/1155/156